MINKLISKLKYKQKNKRKIQKIMDVLFMVLFVIPISLVLITSNKIVILAFLGAMTLLVGYHLLFQFKYYNNTVNLWTGGLGTGKSMLASKYILKAYKWQNILYKLGLVDEIPIMYSNIPIKIQAKGRILFWRKEKWSYQLTREHLIMEDKLYTDADDIKYMPFVFIDEWSMFLGGDQFAYNNPLIQDKVDTFLRYFRHFTGKGKLCITDQSVLNLPYIVKRRCSKAYVLNDFRRVLFFFYKVDVQVIDISTDIVNNAQVDNSDKKPFRFGYLPFRLKYLNWFNIPLLKRYDTRCYSVIYDDVLHKADLLNWNEYKTKYVIDLMPTPEQMAYYKKLKKDGKKED